MIDYQKIKIILLRKGINNSQLAKMLGWGNGRVTSFLNGTASNPTLSTIENVARCLGVDVSSLLKENINHEDLRVKKLRADWGFCAYGVFLVIRDSLKRENININNVKYLFNRGETSDTIINHVLNDYDLFEIDKNGDISIKMIN